MYFVDVWDLVHEKICHEKLLSAKFSQEAH